MLLDLSTSISLPFCASVNESQFDYDEEVTWDYVEEGKT